MTYINPHRLFVGAFLPNWLLKCAEISAEAKLVYARLCQYAGESGEAWPSVAALAEECAINERTMERYLVELKKFGLIESVRRGLGLTNYYRFLWHPIMGIGESDSRAVKGKESATRRVQSPQPSGINTILGKRINEENQRREPEGALPFGSPAFLTAWESWQKYRRERKQALTPSTIKAQLEKLASLSESEAIAVIQTSIEKGWQGLFPERIQKDSRAGGVGVAGCPDRKLMTREDIDRASAELR